MYIPAHLGKAATGIRVFKITLISSLCSYFYAITSMPSSPVASVIAIIWADISDLGNTESHLINSLTDDRCWTIRYVKCSGLSGSLNLVSTYPSYTDNS